MQSQSRDHQLANWQPQHRDLTRASLTLWGSPWAGSARVRWLALDWVQLQVRISTIEGTWGFSANTGVSVSVNGETQGFLFYRDTHLDLGCLSASRETLGSPCIPLLEGKLGESPHLQKGASSVGHIPEQLIHFIWQCLLIPWLWNNCYEIHGANNPFPRNHSPDSSLAWLCETSEVSTIDKFVPIILMTKWHSLQRQSSQLDWEKGEWKLFDSQTYCCIVDGKNEV